NVATSTLVGMNGRINYNGGALVTPSIGLTDGGAMVLSTGGNKLLRTRALMIDTADNSRLDLADNEAILTATPKAGVRQSVAPGRNGGAWNGAGINSPSASANATHTTGLGVLSGAEYASLSGSGTFDGVGVAASDVLVKYTWNGDANFDGRVTFDDYVRIDTG